MPATRWCLSGTGLLIQLHVLSQYNRSCRSNFLCQYTDAGSTSSSADPVSSGARQGSPWSTSFQATGLSRCGKSPKGKSGIRTQICRLVGLVVKASASRGQDPGFESRLRRDFSGSSHTSDFKIGTPVATLPGAWHYRVSTGTGRPGVSIL